MKTESRINWVENLNFQADVDGFKLELDATKEDGSPGRGPRPKPLLLASLAGCTAMDVISVLKKMKEEVTHFDVIAEGNTADDHPKKFISLSLTYSIRGNNIKAENVKKAVKLSIEKYCGVYATLIQALPIQSRILINGEEVSL